MHLEFPQISDDIGEIDAFSAAYCLETHAEGIEATDGRGEEWARATRARGGGCHATQKEAQQVAMGTKLRRTPT
jgi:hypothetical protein